MYAAADGRSVTLCQTSPFSMLLLSAAVCVPTYPVPHHPLSLSPAALCYLPLLPAVNHPCRYEEDVLINNLAYPKLYHVLSFIFCLLS
jgi:hypothetical protein